MPKDKAGVDDFSQIGNIDRLIHEPGRLMIMAYLSVVESADFLFLKRQTGFTWGNLSAHLSKLEDAGYIEVTKEFLDKKPHTVLQLTEAGRSAFNEYRESMTKIFGDLSSN
jgi:DNA-binding MarR family transcriptional regulator